ncbi:hypothetical protein Geob_2419 [Geotalea daltonii FRC-32]|uniref:Uncharacterized protein n=1 Tax=Geotalea daltonii (strain DSM 22248 / JCM 15807 / FRC-32) TaxID=316067 RepID=B9LZZ2_GEODF|nr:hypothetical protein Geob_2419 [Geotalea daltonii FRC-32]
MVLLIPLQMAVLGRDHSPQNSVQLVSVVSDSASRITFLLIQSRCHWFYGRM